MSDNFIYFTDDDCNKEKDEIILNDESIYKSKFSEIKGLGEKIIKQLELLGYVKMTRVQEIVIPKILNGGDILLRAPTGTGKTLSFLIPTIQRSLLNISEKLLIQRSDGTIVLILTPTRELCIQTISLAKSLVAKMSWCVVGCICGGEKRKSEKARLRKGITILGGTPGRIIDHIDSTSCFNVSNLHTLIVDEADRLLEEGFGFSYKKIYQFIMNKNNLINNNILNNNEEDIAMTLNVKLNNESKFENLIKQVILVSATLSKPVEDLANYSLKNNPQWIILDQYKEIDYKERGDDINIDKHVHNETSNIPKKGLFSVPVNLRQECAIIQDKFRIPALISLLLSRTNDNKRTVLFVSSTQVVEFFFALLQSIRWPSKLLIKGGSNMKSFIKLLETYKKDIDRGMITSNNEKNFVNYRKNKIRRKNEDGFSELSESEIDEDNISMLESNDKYEGKRSDNNNFNKRNKKWFTNNTQLIEIFESMFEKYIFKNPIFEDEEITNNKLENHSKSINEFKESSRVINQPPIFMLHGHMNREDRIGQLSSFEKSKEGGILITSDVASRGLNFPKIDTVIQLDPPQSIEEYIHRVGRTARMGEKGTGIIFLRPCEETYIDVLKLYNIINKGITKLSSTTIWEGLISNNCNNGKIDDLPGFYYSIINKIITLDPSDTHNELLNKARRAYAACIRSYLSYDREFSKIFSIKKLHLGHVASSFGINEQPSKISQHIKYIDGVISQKRTNTNDAIKLNRKKKDGNIMKENKKNKIKNKLIKKKLRLNKKGPKFTEEFKIESEKSGIIDKALQLMRNKSEMIV